jgi:hypothetical protein
LCWRTVGSVTAAAIVEGGLTGVERTQTVTAEVREKGEGEKGNAVEKASRFLSERSGRTTRRSLHPLRQRSPGENNSNEHGKGAGYFES